VDGFAAAYAVDDSARTDWDYLQATYVCCGGHGAFDGYLTWAAAATGSGSNGVPNGSGSVPDSCCKKEAVGCGRNVLNRVARRNLHLHIFTRGCMTVIQETLSAEVSPMLRVLAAGALASAFIKVNKHHHLFFSRKNFGANI